MVDRPNIGQHALSLNLFVERGGVYEITVAGHSPAFMRAYEAKQRAGANYKVPHDFAEEMILKAADRIRERRNG